MVTFQAPSNAPTAWAWAAGAAKGAAIQPRQAIATSCLIGSPVPPIRLAPFGKGARPLDVVLAVDVGLHCGIGRRHRRLQGRLVEALVHRLLRRADRHRRAFEDEPRPTFCRGEGLAFGPVSYTHLRAHETGRNLV